jgi:hypothetical protein
VSALHVYPDAVLRVIELEETPILRGEQPGDDSVRTQRNLQSPKTTTPVASAGTRVTADSRPCVAARLGQALDGVKDRWRGQFAHLSAQYLLAIEQILPKMSGYNKF